MIKLRHFYLSPNNSFQTHLPSIIRHIRSLEESKNKSIAFIEFAESKHPQVDAFLKSFLTQEVHHKNILTIPQETHTEPHPRVNCFRPYWSDYNIVVATDSLQGIQKTLEEFRLHFKDKPHLLAGEIPQTVVNPVVFDFGNKEIINVPV